MNNEIKEILDFKENADYKRLSCDEIKVLKDYITNLQEENKRLKENNQSMQEEMARTWNKYDDYKSRIDKAISLLKEAGCYDEETKTFCDDVWDELPDLLNILQGE